MKSNRTLFFLIIAVIISRLPLLFGGYGTDGDAWRIANSALTAWTEGHYEMSRFPGFPLYELIQSPIITLGGSFASNSSTLFVFILSVIIFQQIVFHWYIPHADLIVITYAFLPIFWKNSAITMDYVWGLFGLFYTINLLLNKKTLLAAIVLGLSAGIRLSHLMYLFPLLILVQQSDKKSILYFSIISVGTAGLCYLPVFFSAEFFDAYQEFVQRSNNHSMVYIAGLFLHRITYSVGLAGIIALAVVFFQQRTLIAGVFQSERGKFVAAISVITLLMFGVMPDEREYLIPMMPFLIILTAMVATRKQCIFVSIFLISYALVSIELFSRDGNNVSFSPNIRSGYVVAEYHRRSEFLQRKEQLSQIKMPDSSFVMIGLGPIFSLDNPYVIRDTEKEKELAQECAKSLAGRERYFIYALTRSQIDELRKKGFAIYYWDEMKDYLESFIAYDLAELSVLPLSMRQE